MYLKKIVLFFITLCFAGCSTLSVAKVNAPAIEYFGQESAATVRSGGDGLAVQARFNRRIDLRNKLIDSLDILSGRNLIIIDREGSYEGRGYEESYFFFYNKCIHVLQENKENPKPRIENREQKEFDYYGEDDILAVYNHFKKAAIADIVDYKGVVPSSTYYITAVKGNSVRYYKTSTSNFKVIQLQ